MSDWDPTTPDGIPVQPDEVPIDPPIDPLLADPPDTSGVDPWAATIPSSAVPTGGVPSLADVPDATTQMPVIQTGVDGGEIPPIPPAGLPSDDFGVPEDEPLPWYKRPGPLAAAIVGGIAAVGLVVFAIASLVGDDDGTVIVITDGSTTTTTTIADTTTSAATTTTSEATTTSLQTTTTAAADTTTTAPPTTAAPTTAAPTTAPSTTAAPPPAPTTTIPEVVVPPQPQATLWDIIANSPDLSSARDLFELAGLESDLDDPDAVYTVFVPSNAAVENAMSGVGAPDFGDPDVVRDIMLAQIHSGEALQASAILEMASVSVQFGGPQPVDADATPPTIGGAVLIVVDVDASNGELQVTDKVMSPVEG